MKLFVGLGNPDPGYARHRHNIGFMAADAIAAAHGFGPWRAKFRGQIAEGRLGPEKVLLLKPGTYMNLSGDAVRAALQFYKLEPGDVAVFHDELDLAPGRVRVKTGGGTAGHNGLRSIDAHIGPDFTRVRLGIGHPGDKRLVSNHVLGDFAKADAEWVDDLLAAVAEGAPALAAGDTPGFLNAVSRRMQPPAAAKPEPAPPPAPAPAEPEEHRDPAAKAGGPLPLTSREAFRFQAAACAGMGSPFTARLCTLLADRLAPGGAVADRVLDWPGDPRADALPLRLAGACTGSCSRDAPPASPRSIRRTTPTTPRSGRPWRQPSPRCALSPPPPRGPPQTNEAQRTAALCPGFLTVAALPACRSPPPSSAPAPGSTSPGTASPTASAPPPGATRPRRSRSRPTGRARRRRCRPPASPSAPAATWRRSTWPRPRTGCGCSPTSGPTRPRAWRACAPRSTIARANQRPRRDRRRRRLARPRLDAPRPGRAHVVYHSVFWQYLPPETQARIRASLEAAGARAPADGAARLAADGGRRRRPRRRDHADASGRAARRACSAAPTSTAPGCGGAAGASLS